MGLLFSILSAKVQCYYVCRTNKKIYDFTLKAFKFWTSKFILKLYQLAFFFPLICDCAYELDVIYIIMGYQKIMCLGADLP